MHHNSYQTFHLNLSCCYSQKAGYSWTIDKVEDILPSETSFLSCNNHISHLPGLPVVLATAMCGGQGMSVLKLLGRSSLHYILILGNMRLHSGWKLRLHFELQYLAYKDIVSNIFFHCLQLLSCTIEWGTLEVEATLIVILFLRSVHVNVEVYVG